MVVALSGGADSAALAFLVRETGRKLSVVHIDHQLPASPRMSEAAHEVASVLGVDIETRRVTLGKGPSPEEKAREARYQALSDLAARVLTGHTRDDSVETVLINLIRGTGPSGLTGIPRFRPPNVFRPILDVTRSETREITTLARLPFFDDPMNLDMSLTRNRVRHEILPLMRELNPQIETALARTTATLARDIDYLNRLSPEYPRGVPVSVVMTLPRPLADRVLHRTLEDSGIGPTADRIERMWSVASGDSERQDLADGHIAVRRGALLVIERATNFADPTDS